MEYILDKDRNETVELTVWNLDLYSQLTDGNTIRPEKLIPEKYKRQTKHRMKFTLPFAQKT